jgi:cytosine/adenosine deaminase-related metal-dependent hydrolase
MKLISADYVVTCDENFTIIEGGAVVFDEKIIDIGIKEDIQAKYPDETIEYQGAHSVIMPGLINTHVHLEFSANKTTLTYGNFVKWLFSVIENREELIEKATKELMDIELQHMINNGTTTIGAISSHAFDLRSCVESPINVVYFTEILGSKAEMIDTLFLDFKEKLRSAKEFKSKNFIPAIAIHSPYSTHPFLIREVLNIARNENYTVSAHFQESQAESDWLNYSSGEFELFFKDMLDQHESFQKPSSFLYQFKGIENLSFTHCVKANKKELAQIKELGASITHCPNSNRLLNNAILNLSHIEDIPLAMGTDGLSSNHTLNMFEELRSALYMHTNFDPNDLSKKLLLASTSGGAKALGLHKKGILKENFDADIISFNLPDTVKTLDNLSTAIILHTSKTNNTFIGGVNAIS